MIDLKFPVTRALALVFPSLMTLAPGATTDGPLRIDMMAGPNLVVDSNVESPSTNGPSAAHMGVRVTNTGATSLTDVEVRIGNLTDAVTGAGTAGIFPSRSVSVSGSSGYSGTFALQMPGGAADAVRIIPSLAPGASVMQYFFITYPLKDGAGKSVAGAAPDPSDDLWLNYDIWASAREGAATRRVDRRSKVTMRNEISAMANKIWPNTTGKVPSKYLDAIQASLGWRPDDSTPRAGSTARLEGIWYDMGNVGAGFDNDGDGLPDRNAWMQPVGDPSRFDPLSLRLVKSYGIVIIKLRDGTEKLIPFEDQLYFSNIPDNNTGAVGLVYYEFLPISAGKTSQLSPYQEVASGFDNEKFNGDYGNSVGSFTAAPPEVSFTKAGPSTVAGGGTAAYSLTATNTGGTAIGLPELALPFVFEDAIPAGLVYTAGSATASNTVPAGNPMTVIWSTDNGATWVATEPAAATVTHIRWTLASALAPGSTAVARFQATVPVIYPSVTVDNTGVIKLGPTGELASHTVRTFVSGINSTGDLIWRDDNRDGVKGAAEPGIANITVRLYFDSNNNGTLDAADPLFATTVTDANGIYNFISLPDGRFIAVVDQTDTDLPAGFTLPNSAPAAIAVALDPARTNASAVSVLTADWPFIGALTVAKSTNPVSYGAGDTVTYTIDLENHAAPVAAKTVPVQSSWSTTLTGNRAAQNFTNAQGSPDNNYARIDWAQNADNLANSGLAFANPTGTITKVEFIFNAYLSAPLTDDQLDFSVNGTLFSTVTTATLNAMTGPAAIRSIDITSRNATWTWPLVQALTANMVAKKSGSQDGSTLWVDSVGFRVTTTATPPAPGSYGPSSISPLPLVDSFDATKLAYISASVAPTSMAAGTITWADLGPLNAGARRTITVTFRALQPPDTNGNGEPDATTVLNTAASTGARFVSGLPANPASGNVSVTINPRGSIGDLVWLDANANGIKDVSEPGLANVLVTLSNGAQVRTDSNGYYFFGNLADGTYTVTVETGTLPWSTFTQTKDPDATANNASTVTINLADGLANNDSFLDRDFGYRSNTSALISGTLFADLNGNGIREAAEATLVGVTVTLLRDADLNGSFETTFATTTTDGNGFYQFGSLPAGSFRVLVTQPASTVQTLDPDLTPGATTGDNAVNRTTVAGGSSINNNFAYRPSGTLAIGDTLYFDWNGNGIQDAGENGIAGADVRLFRDINGDGVIDPGTDSLVATTVTGSTGTYLFSGLAAGRYLVDVNQTAAAIPNDATGNKFRVTTADPHDVTLAAGQTYLAADFGFSASASIGDFVFFDANGNGTQDVGEGGIPGVTVQLFADANRDGVPDSGTPIANVVTADGSGALPAGFYQFAGLAAGTYHVKVLTSTLPQQGGQPIPQTSDPDRDGIPLGDTSVPGLPPGDHADSLVIVSLGSSYSGADFGYQPTGALGDFVWLDLDQDGVQDEGEPGIANVTVRISDGTTTYQRVTDLDGRWSVANVPDGAWTVDIPAFNFSGGALANTVPTFDADGGLNSSVAITLTLGNVNLAAGNLGLDFGYAFAGSRSISGTVLTHDTRVSGTADDIDDFFDDGVDQDAGPDDEVELAGITVYLYTNTGSLLGSTVTGSGGYYQFDGLPAGTYRVIIGTSYPALENSTLTTTVANNPAVSSVNASSGTTVIQTVAVGSSDVTRVDFAFISNVAYDYGDLPRSYGMTTLAQDGARHSIPSGGSTVFLGSAPDSDTDGVTTPLADGDDKIGADDEDGVIPVSPAAWTEGASGGSVQVNVTGSGWLVGWIDWNRDGTFLDAGELVISQAVSSGSPVFSFPIPAGSIGAGSASWLSRFRIFTAKPAYPLFAFSGLAADGEVEDLLIEKPVGASIGDIVWIDSNGNGLKELNEDGIGGRIVELRNSSNQLVATQTTGNGSQDVDGDGVIDPAGYYRFRGLAAGNYTVRVTNPPAGYQAGHDEDGIGTPHASGVVLATGVQHLSADFGYAPMLADISGQVRYDADGDGDFSDPDAGAVGVKIQLWTDPDGNGNPSDGMQVAETFTNGSGNYIFTSVPTGNYVIVEINSAGSTSTADVAGANDDRIPVALVGVNITGRDFLDTAPPVYAILGTVFDDARGTDDNVIGPDDTAVGGISIELYFDRDRDGSVTPGDTLVASALTGGSGNYAFADLPAGNYVVRSVTPGGAVLEWDAQGNPADGQIAVVLADADVDDRNFLIDNYLGAIYGSVFANNGAGNVAMPNVTVTLRDGTGTPVASATTGADGSYIFDHLAPGNYQVAEIQPAGYGSASDRDGGDKNLIGDQTPIVLAGNVSTGNDFINFLQECPDLWTDWQDEWDAELGGDTGLTGNPDGDRYGNLLEYAFCMSPVDGTEKPMCLVASSTVAGAVDAVFHRTAGGPLDITFKLEYTSALGLVTSWSSIDLGPANTVVTDEGDGSEMVRVPDVETLTGLTAGKGFVRIRVDLDNGVEQASAAAEVMGWVETGLDLCCRTYNNPFLRCSSFTGTVDSVDGQDLVFTTSAGTADLADSMVPGAAYYVEVTSGPAEGHRFDVVSGSGSRLTLANDSDVHATAAPFNTMTGAPPAGLAGAAVILRRHWTLAETFPPAGLGASATLSTADEVQMFANGAWIIHSLFDDAGTPRWVDPADAGLSDRGALVLPPGRGMFYNNRTLAASILAYGEVRENRFVHPLAAGNSLVGGGYPVEQSAWGTSGRALETAGGFFGSRNFKTADSFLLWNADRTTGGTGYSTYFLLDGAPTQPALKRWVMVGDANLLPREGELLFEGNRSVFLRAAGARATYGYPAPWND